MKSRITESQNQSTAPSCSKLKPIVDRCRAKFSKAQDLASPADGIASLISLQTAGASRILLPTMDFRLVSAKTLLPWTQSLEWDANCRAKLLQENPRITLYNIYIYIQ